MPLQSSRIFELLNEKRDRFSLFNQQAGDILRQYWDAMDTFVRLSDAEREALIRQHSGKLGARPLESMDKAKQGVVSAGLQWKNREESHRWVRDRLEGVTTFAVDGSQIYPGKDLSLPIALVQIGWFENHHQAEGGYTKDVQVDVMPPDELRTEGGDFADRQVNMRRYRMEVDRLVDYIEAHSQAERSLLFFDGSLVATFAQRFDDEARQFYINCLLRLLRASEAHRVPVVGYIDTTYADDLTVMLRQLYDLPDASMVHDAQLVNRLPMAWGDRTPLFQCDRADILSAYAEHKDRIGFVYLKTTRDHYPVRVEFPLWVVEAGRLDEILDWVRAEVIIGGGYPYAIETADQTAVLQAGDRQMFFRIVQEWASRESLGLRLSRKMVSKIRRR
ncbi:MAG: DNA double-strand break repair nuclease NurA [Cyanobacteria bacterium J06638_22]